MAKQLYEGEINEFTDWITGVDSTTGEKVTELEISGGSIRNLLQNRLVKPFYGHYDKEQGLCLLFSSETAYNIWKNTDDEDLKESLILFSFNAPSDYEFEITEAPASLYYMRNGDSSSVAATASFKWRILRGLAEFVDGMVATYTITNGNTSKTFSRIYNGNSGINSVNESIYNYLSEGSNSVQIYIKSQNTSAAASISYTITVVTLSVASNFNFYRNLSNISGLDASDDSRKILFLAYISRNVDSEFVVYAIIDNDIDKLYTRTISDQSASVTDTITFTARKLFEETKPLTYGVHTLQVYATQEFESQVIKSNLLYYTFTVHDDDSAALPEGIRTINFGVSVPSFSVTYDAETFQLKATLYEKFTLGWGYYISITKDLSISVAWKLMCQAHDESVTYVDVGTLTGTLKTRSEDLVFIPNISSENYANIYLTAYYGNLLLIKIPIYIQKSPYSISENSSYGLKLSAYGRVNNSSTADTWTFENITTYFKNIAWNDLSGWYLNSFRTKGTDLYALVNFNIFDAYGGELPIKNGITVEIDFESENVASNDDVILLVGELDKQCFKVTPNSASFVVNGQEIVKTNYKANERIKVCFIIYPAGYEDHTGGHYFSRLATIVTDGILERGASYSGVEQLLVTQPTTKINVGTLLVPLYVFTNGIKIGGSNSGIRLYSLRCYNLAIRFLEAYNNYVFDSEEKALIISNNDVLSGVNIVQEKCQTKLDVINISTPYEGITTIDEIIADPSTSKADSQIPCVIERICPSDASKNFKIENGLIRKHGQSTLNYAVPSFKIWSNTNPGYVVNESGKNIPGVYGEARLICDSLVDLGLNKNRYQMKNDAIPCNKWVLQANYADSSGVHNGGLLRLILNTWYSAVLDQLNVLRTPPQLFSSNSTYHRRDGGYDGYSNVTDNNGGVKTLRYPNKLWKDLNASDRGVNNPAAEFPYRIRVAPDSLPCVVFYKNTKTDKSTFLGQYVFMDDKKSDTLYGERSIYKFIKDPFCLTTAHSKDDDNVNMIWDNDDVLRIEVLNVNTLFTSYMNSSKGTNMELTSWIADPEDTVNGGHYAWQEDFELIYPDPDDLTYNPVHNYTDPPKKTVERKTKPFIDWLEWLTSTYDSTVALAVRNHTVTEDLVEHEPFKTFIQTADLHLDIYKLAAYYIFVLRFGLVDSLERNVQIKTYDGQHFWYEPWDMDIALGNQNTGGIRFEPPITRDTKLDDTTWALSGRSNSTSNWLFDALEAWPEWKTVIVPKVADALFKAGLTYRNVTEMFDTNYASAWNETMYNYSGFFKYIQQGGGSADMLAWLQGARKTHRHWWLKTSFDYYDALWGVGEFANSDIYMQANHALHDPGSIYITSRAATFFSVDRDGLNLGTKEASADVPVEYDITEIAISTKTPVRILGAYFIKELDVSIFARSLNRIMTLGAYSDEIGPCIKKLNMGCGLQAGTVYDTTIDNRHLIKEAVSGNAYTSYLNTVGFSLIYYNDSIPNTLKLLETFNVRGILALTSTSDLIGNTSDLYNLHTFYAMGSGLKSFQGAPSGNLFQILELPSSIEVFLLENSSFQEVTFWDTEINTSDAYEEVQDDPEDDSTIRRVPVKTGRHTKYTINNLDVTYHIPSALHTVVFNGTTGKQNCAKQFVQDWIKCIDAQVAAAQTAEEKAAIGFSSKTLLMDNVYWEGLTFEEISKIAQMKNHASIKGYICLTGGIPTATQLAQLMQWFGSAIFIKGSELIIDYESDTTVITFDADDSIKKGSGSTGDEYPVNVGESLPTNVPLMYIKEGYLGREATGYRGVYINATEFRLRESDSSDYIWTLHDPVSNADYLHAYKSVEIVEVPTGANDLGVQQYQRYLKATPSTYDDYYVTLRVSSLKTTAVQLIAVKVVTVLYPDDYSIFLTDNCLFTRKFGNFVSLYLSNASIEFFAKPDHEVEFIADDITNNPASLNSITYTIKDLDNNIILLSGFNPQLHIDYDETITQGMKISTKNLSSLAANMLYAMRYVLNGITLSGDTPKNYNISAVVSIGAKTFICGLSVMLIAENPLEALLIPTNQMFNPMALEFESEYGALLTAAIYISDVYVLNGILVANDNNVLNKEDNKFNNTLAYRPSNTSVFQYCVNLNGIDLSNSPYITNAKTLTVDGSTLTIYQIVFPLNNKLTILKTNNCTALDNLDYQYLTSLVTLELKNCPSVTSIDLTNNTNLLDIKLSGCTGLTALDITHCTKLRTLDVTGTTALSSITLPTSSLFESVKFGNPSAINIPSVSLFTGDSGITNNEWDKPITGTTESKISFTSVSNLSSITLNAGDNGVGAISTLCRILDAKYNNGGA